MEDKKEGKWYSLVWSLGDNSAEDNMQWSSVVINWQGRALSGEELQLLEVAAVRYMQDHRRAAAVEFEHRLCTGVLRCKNEGRFGTFSGVIFHAYLGEHVDRPRTADFLVVDGMEDYILSTSKNLHLFSAMPGEDGGPVIRELSRSTPKGLKLASVRSYN